MVVEGPDHGKSNDKPPIKRRRVPTNNSTKSGGVILLSCFEGIGAAPLALQAVVGELVLHVSWECDPECILILKKHFPHAVHRGNFLEDDATAVAQLVLEYDSTGECMILQVGAPPCPDFSRIRDDAPGREGEEGAKFTQYCTFSRSIREQLPDHTFRQLCENVILSDRSEVDFFSQELGIPPIIVDGADFQVVSRPRLWWSDIQWSSQQKNPLNGQQLRWSREHRLHRLHIDPEPTSLQNINTKDVDFPPKVKERTALMPCFTTPAPTSAGRSAPRKTRGKVDPLVKARWLADGRCFAPWQYHENALMVDQAGQLQVPTASVKEQVHGFPEDWTLHDNVPERSRHRMVANSWHVGVARFLMMLLCGATQPVDGFTISIPTSPRQSTLQWMVEMTSHYPAHMGPGQWKLAPSCIPPSFGELAHWAQSQSVSHPLLRAPQIDPGLQQAFDLQMHWTHDLQRIRAEITSEVQSMVEQAAEDTMQWWRQLPAHVAAVYYNPKFDQITQIPVFIHLLRQFQCPGVDTLREDLEKGFATMGLLNHGEGWLPRSDGRYSNPLDMEVFHKLNRQQTMSRLQHYKVDECWESMQQELLEELRLGRLEGPFETPSWWPRSSARLPGIPLVPLTNEDIYVAFCFSVKQEDKIRRCEDYRRSFHNSTIEAYDSVPHDDIQKHVELARAYSQQSSLCKFWAQDLSSAYRQFPVKHPEDCYTVLNTPSGPLLFRHRALPFGSSASVWSFNRAADALTFLARRMLLVTTGHYVDDWAAAEQDSTVDSGYTAFEAIFQCLGLRMKPKKAQPPNYTQKILGVEIMVDKEAVTLRPHAKRVKKVSNLIDTALDHDYLDADQAQRLAGKVLFLSTTMFGQIGRPALQPLYGRAFHEQHKGATCNNLNSGLRAALRSLRLWLSAPKDRTIPLQCSSTPAVLYTDAFYEAGTPLVPHSRWRHPKRRHENTSPSKNGWGFVARIGERVLFAHGTVPAKLVKQFGKRKAFIYALEICAQLICFVCLQHHLPTLVVSFCDNTAGLSALLKGYGKDERINGLLLVTWRTATPPWLAYKLPMGGQSEQHLRQDQSTPDPVGFGFGLDSNSS